MAWNSGVINPEYVAPFFRFQSFSELLRKFNIFKNHANPENTIANEFWNRWANELRDLGDSVFSKCMICTPTPVHFVHHRCGYTLGLIPLHKFLKLWNNYRSIGLLFANNLSPWLLFLVTCTDIYGFLCHFSQLFRNCFAIIRNYSQLFAN
jgi:hypothetical protein